MPGMIPSRLMVVLSMKTIRNLLILGIFSISGSMSISISAMAGDCPAAPDAMASALANLVTAPVITGDDEADARIRLLAESRGYRPQMVLADQKKLVFPWSIHHCVLASWQAMRSAALEQGFALSIVSGYRSIARQRQIFLSKLDAYDVAVEDILNGAADRRIHAILEFSAIPGYSRHHNGFTIDIQNDGTGLNDFGNSPAYHWLAADSFRIARQFGFLPSYPDELPGQGPVPEPWEFIWVGESAQSASAGELSAMRGNPLIEVARRILAALDRADPGQSLAGPSSPAGPLPIDDGLPGG